VLSFALATVVPDTSGQWLHLLPLGLFA